MDSDLKELVYKSLQRAVVVEKDIQEYQSIWKKNRIYVLNRFQLNETLVLSKFDSVKNAYEINSKKDYKYLKLDEIPNEIGNVAFCLKSKSELQKIADKTREDFLFLSFSMIKIEKETATIKINNTWKVSKHSKKIYLSGGGYTCKYQKINGEWKFNKIISRWIS
ncbi:hypothetical protein JL193_07920 [Polaribacter batillariae]|uniref:SnoaL-like domain-containing protein n=1 Tax=Polaribacter batillariae TaxID=2808900 RepID=A0ABX7T0W5_9FLAO|nr:hypothetical protein [Polaribacter batillariae]QTD39153.1 hypothetical protein JL193_07920 [Polaribacter batillariae]